MGCRVLVADDAAFVRRKLVSIVIDGGHEVVAEASDGKEAVAAYLEFRPDAVIMDVLMPQVDGLSATRAICSQDPDARVIICSAVAEPTIVTQAMAAGAFDFVVKPVATERLLQALSRVIGCARTGGGSSGAAG